jgi:myo-inositol-1(or 4)-monophosphatase
MADKRAEATLVEELRNARPDWGMLLEEGGEIAGNPDKPRWIVDPLDGTTNFLHGIPHFSISIAVEEKKPGGGTEITQGLVYQPLTDDSYWAEKGRGAWLQDARLRASARRDLSECLVGTGIPHCGRGDAERWSKIYAAVGPQVSGVRRFGSAALDLAWVAAGRMDGFWEDDLDVWDTAAGVLLVKEAGGFVSDYRGGDQMFKRGEYVAGSGAIHSKLQKLVAGALR